MLEAITEEATFPKFVACWLVVVLSSTGRTTSVWDIFSKSTIIRYCDSTRNGAFQIYIYIYIYMYVYINIYIYMYMYIFENWTKLIKVQNYLNLLLSI